MNRFLSKFRFIEIWPLILALLIIRINFGCASKKQVAMNNNGTTEKRVAADSSHKQIVTELDGDKMKKTMDYPYLRVQFNQNDTELEIVLDPESTNLALDLVRNSTSDIEIIYGDSTYSRKDKESALEDLITGLKKKKNSKEDLTDDILQDINLAQKLFYEKHFDQALKVLQASLEKKETATAYSLGGSIYFVSGEIDEAVRAWENALKIDPDLEEVRELVGRYKE
jgi:tetratricopeptide (TPR) repeat protein